MSLHFLIDGYNAINKLKPLKNRLSLKDARLSLINMIQEKKLSGSNKLTVIFDGREQFSFFYKQNSGLIKIIFSSCESADELIKRKVAESDNPRGLVVVSDDKAIAYFIKSMGAKAVSVDTFFGKAIQLQKNSNPCSDKQLQKRKLTYRQKEKINQELRKIWG